MATNLSIEAERLACLSHYDVLQSLQEDVFDKVVELAARIFNLPISLLNVVEETHVRTGAQYGWPGSAPQPRAEMLCSSLVEQRQVVVYHDLATVSPTPAAAQAVRTALAQHVRFYAAAPVCLPDEHCVGTLCLLDQQPRKFTSEEQQVLERLAQLVSQAIIIRQHYCATPEGEVHWQGLRTQLHDEVHELGALVRYLLARYGLTVPVPDEVLRLVSRRLADLHVLLQETA